MNVPIAKVIYINKKTEKNTIVLFCNKKLEHNCPKQENNRIEGKIDNKKNRNLEMPKISSKESDRKKDTINCK